ncbi:hypothetical protein PY650_09835 [Rhizobium calliandrae]|uniref:Uncharacterized protein n=1 Tax=Rhizobium calliandrae TaxID=1312182 RepID=A0ABT7KBI0_9HYPH|nr:hypothetical protein [Rhizobium calliandrae]MDL2405960.1 hypothetical protein [Rhizobium calliandrae]
MSAFALRRREIKNHVRHIFGAHEFAVDRVPQHDRLDDLPSGDAEPLGLPDQSVLGVIRHLSGLALTKVTLQRKP